MGYKSGKLRFSLCYPIVVIFNWIFWAISIECLEWNTECNVLKEYLKHFWIYKL